MNNQEQLDESIKQRCAQLVEREINNEANSSLGLPESVRSILRSLANRLSVKIKGLK